MLNKIWDELVSQKEELSKKLGTFNINRKVHVNISADNNLEFIEIEAWNFTTYPYNQWTLRTQFKPIDQEIEVRMEREWRHRYGYTEVISQKLTSVQEAVDFAIQETEKEKLNCDRVLESGLKLL